MQAASLFLVHILALTTDQPKSRSVQWARHAESFRLRHSFGQRHKSCHVNRQSFHCNQLQSRARNWFYVAPHPEERPVLSSESTVRRDGMLGIVAKRVRVPVESWSPFKTRLTLD